MSTGMVEHHYCTMLYVVKPSLSRYKSDGRVRVNYCWIERICHHCHVSIYWKVHFLEELLSQISQWKVWEELHKSSFRRNHCGTKKGQQKMTWKCHNVIDAYMTFASCHSSLVLSYFHVILHMSGLIITFTCTLRILAKLDGGPHESAHFRWDRKGRNKISGYERSCCCLQLSKLMRSHQSLSDLQNTG